jgi:phenylalanyl-tRNA synthetase beta chain
MKISYNWLKKYITTTDGALDLPIQTMSELLTNCGLEVESVEKEETIKGGLKGIVVGEVMSKEKHPDADKLSLTTVNIGAAELLHIVCGAPNIAAGQKVLVATIGAELYTGEGEAFTIKKSKIRGALSEGMVCAEDELGLGKSHEGIMVLDADAIVGESAVAYCSRKKEFPPIKEDYVFEIGLTPNRADAASHFGTARDVVAVLTCQNTKASLQLPPIDAFTVDNTNLTIAVSVENSALCPRYAGISISNVTVKESPAWMQNSLKAIGIRPINNIVDATNFVLHELGQPLHAFDADKIAGKKVIVKTVADKTKFTSLDGAERELSAEDLMICDAEKPMCIAGVFGGLNSGVSNTTKNIFLESAYFNSTTVRKSSKRHDLKTDASFRFERGTDPNMCVFALKRAALLIKEVAGGEISSNLIDIYPTKIEHFSVTFSFEKCNQLIGKVLNKELIKNIITSLDIEILKETNEVLQLSIPPFKVDVQREQDVIEEILRIYGYNNIEIPSLLNASIQFSDTINKEKIQNTISNLLSNNGFAEIMCLSLTKGDYANQLNSLLAENNVAMMNPLSSDLNVLRQTPLFSGLETIVHNQNRKQADLKLYEFGKTYHVFKSEEGDKYVESKRLSVFITGRKDGEAWNTAKDNVSFYTLKGFVEAIIERLGIPKVKLSELESDVYSSALSFTWKKKTLVSFGTVASAIIKKAGIKQAVFYADFDWDVMLEAIQSAKTAYTEVSKFPEVRRDLALLIDKKTSFDALEKLALQTETNLLKTVSLFDVYEGDKLPDGKKSYALSFILQDEKATLTDTQIDKVMDKLIRTYQEKAGAEIR